MKCSASALTFTIKGTVFTSNLSVTLGNSFYPSPNMPISSRSSTQLVINPTFGTTAATWYAKVIDGSQSSSQFSFEVQEIGRASCRVKWKSRWLTYVTENKQVKAQ